MFSSALVCLFVCYQDYTKSTQRIFTKFGGKVARGQRKKPLLVFNGSLITLRSGLSRVRVTVTSVHRHTPHGRKLPGVCLTVTFFATSAALALYSVSFQLHICHI